MRTSRATAARCCASLALVAAFSRFCCSYSTCGSRHAVWAHGSAVVNFDPKNETI